MRAIPVADEDGWNHVGMDHLDPDVDPAPSGHDQDLVDDALDDDLDDDLEDADLAGAFTFAQLDVRRLLDRQVLHLIAGLAVAIAVIVWPQRTDRVLARLIGLLIVVVFSSAAWTAVRHRPRDAGAFALSLLAAVAGGFLLVYPNQSVEVMGRGIAAGIVLFSVYSLLANFREPAPDRVWAWPLAKTMAALSLAALIAIYPTDLIALVVVTLALGSATVAIVALTQSLRADDPRSWKSGESRDIIIDWLDSRPKEAGDRRELYAKILYEGPTLRLRVIRFLTLMAFASVIAAMGVITDSTAVVIGAMLVAPLMTPLMGAAISVVMGWPNRLTRSAAIALVGVVMTIVIGVILGLIVPTTIDVATNSQILARSTPTILDLITAIAAGAAGAYGLSRPDVSDALPGVAIAISLVPPLSVVGIAWSQGAWAEGNGALLLFITNALAIVVVGGATFVFTGVTPIRRVAQNQRRVRTAAASLFTLAAAVVGSLALNGGEIAANAIVINTVEQTAADWVEETGEHTLVEAKISGDRVTVVILGSVTDPPSADDLYERLTAKLAKDVVVDVRILPQLREVSPEGALDG